MKKLQKRSKRNLLIGFGCSLLVLIFSSVLSYTSIKNLLNSQSWVVHTINVESEFENLISRMKDAETGQRGFLLTNDVSFLEPYNNSKTEVMNYFNQVQILTRDNVDQQNDFPKLEALINKKFVIIDKTIADKKLGMTISTATLLSGKTVMDSIRTVINTMVNREKALMLTRATEVKKFTSYAPVSIAIAALIAIVIAILFYFRVQEDARLSIKLEEELIKHDELKSNQITTISNIAEKIAKGDYTTRI